MVGGPSVRRRSSYLVEDVLFAPVRANRPIQEADCVSSNQACVSDLDARLSLRVSAASTRFRRAHARRLRSHGARVARAGHVPLATFDRELGKLDDVERLWRRPTSRFGKLPSRFHERDGDGNYVPANHVDGAAPPRPRGPSRPPGPTSRCYWARPARTPSCRHSTRRSSRLARHRDRCLARRRCRGSDPR
jgi:hypothetical protein